MQYNWARIAKAWKAIAEDFKNNDGYYSKSGDPGICCAIPKINGAALFAPYRIELTKPEARIMLRAVDTERVRLQKKHRQQLYWTFLWPRDKAGHKKRAAFCLRQMKKALDQAIDS